MYFVISVVNQSIHITKTTDLARAKKYLIDSVNEIIEEDCLEDDESYISPDGLTGYCRSYYDYNFYIIDIDSDDIEDIY